MYLKRFLYAAATTMLATLLLASFSLAAQISPLTTDNDAVALPQHEQPAKDAPIPQAAALGDVVDFDAALDAGADYLRRLQADITEDNAGNGTDGVDETPDDPDDGGWDWVLNAGTDPFAHSTNNSPTNTYGATAQGLYYAYLETGNSSYFTALQDVADRAVAAGPNTIRAGADMKFLMLFNDLYSTEVAPTTVYENAAKAKYDGRITAYGGSATALAQYIRDARAGQGYENGIIAWDIGIYAVVAQMLYDRFGGTYDQDADDIAEVLWQDSYNDSPGYFDVVDDAGFDPAYDSLDYYWYNLGITGLLDAFDASGTHTTEIPGLIQRLLDSQHGNGAIGFSYGVNTDDEDWQSTAYAALSLANYDQATYQDAINRMGYYIAATQDATEGAWIYSSGSHYTETGGENTAALFFTTNTVTDVLVDDDFASQADVDAYNTANGTNYTYGYDAFGSINDGIDGVNGSTITVLAGTYYETLNITTAGLNIIGVDRATVVIDPTGLASNNAGVYVAADNVSIQSLTIQATPANSLPRYGLKFGDVTGGVVQDVTVRDCYRSGLDVLGASALTITDVACIDNGGHGLSLVDCNGVNVTDLTVSGNSWQGVSVATWGRYTPLGTSDIVFAGTNTFSDVMQLEMGDYNNPGVPPAGDAIITYSTNIADGADVTVQAADFGFAVHGEQDDAPDQSRIWFVPTLSDASTVLSLAPIGHFNGNDMYIEDLVDPTQLYVTAGGTIQAAIDAADPGDDINVGTGTYNENIDVHTHVHILGAGSGVDPLTNTIIAQDVASAGDTKIGVVQLTTSGASGADPMLFRDLRVAPDGMAGFSVGRFTEATGQNISYIELDNVVVVGNNVNPNTEQERGLYVDLTSSLTNLTITDCSFDSLTYGWYFQKQVSADASTVQFVDVTNTTFNHNNHKGIYAEKLSDATFTGCTVSENGFTDVGMPSYFVPWMAGVDINLKAGTYANFSFLNCTVTDNALGGAKEGVGLTVKGRGTGNNPSSSYTTYPAWVDNVVITGGTYTGNERGMRFGEPGKENASPTNVVITDADIYGNVQNYSGSDGTAYGDVINQMMAGVGVSAEANWWGTVSYSTIDANTPGEVDFDPWCSDATHTNCTLTSPITEVWVDDDWAGLSEGDPIDGHVFGYNAFAAIQDGIDGVNGSTVHVAAGTYVGDITINKPLVLIGDNPAGSASPSILQGLVDVTSTDVTISQMKISPGAVTGNAAAILLTSPGNCAITDNIIDGMTGDGTGSIKGIHVYSGTGHSGVTITGNTIQNLDIPSGIKGSYGIMIQQDVDAVTADNNTIQNISGDGWAVGLEVTPDYNGVSPTNIAVTNNTFQNIVGVTYGDVAVQSSADGSAVADASEITVTGNLFLTAMGVISRDLVNTLDASFNYWNAVDGPGVDGPGAGAGVRNGSNHLGSPTGQVDYSPWYGFTPGTVPMNWGTDQSIQEAVDAAAAGDQVNAYAGTYEEQIDIGLDLTLVGEDQATTFIHSPTSLTTSFSTGSNDNYPIVYVHDADVDISGFTVDGLNRGNGNYRFVGVAFWNAGGSVTDCAITGITDTPFSGSQHGNGIYAYNNTGGPYAIDITDVDIDDFQKNGVTLLGEGLDVSVTGCSITGIGATGTTAQNGIQLGYGSGGTITDCTVDGIAYTGSGWVASGMLFYQGGVVDVTGCAVTNSQANIIYQETDGTVTDLTVVTGGVASEEGVSIRDYAGVKSAESEATPVSPLIEAYDETATKAAPTTVTIDGATLTGAGAAGSYGVAAWSIGDNVNVSVTNSSVTGWEIGFVAYEDGSVVDFFASLNNVSSNSAGMWTNAAASQLVENNYWGSYDGPADTGGVSEATIATCFSAADMFNTVAEVHGSLGDTVQGLVDYCPWISAGVQFSTDEIVHHCPGTISFDVLASPNIELLEGANIAIEFPAELAFTAATVADANYQLLPISQSSDGIGYDTVFIPFIVKTGWLDGPAAMYTVNFTANDNICAGDDISMVAADLRDTANASISTPLPLPINVTVDCADPTFATSTTSGGYFNSPPTLDVSATDDCDLDAIYYQIDGCGTGWTVLASALSGTSYSTNWTLPQAEFDALTEASHCLRFRVIDDAGRGNADSCTFTWCFTKDVTLPPAPTDLVAEPGHNKVKLSWTNAGSDFDHTVIMRTDWNASGHGYPNYGSLNGSPEGPYPTDTTTGDYILATTGNSHTDTDDLSNTTRDIYHYAAFTVDAAGNVSAAGATARSTSYWIGDVAGGGGFGDYDGFVYAEDLNPLTIVYGQSDGDVNWNSELDYGPSDPGGAKDVPTPDDSVNFEDGILFAINFDAVNPTMKVAPIFENQQVTGPLAVALEAVEGGYAMHLLNNEGNVKGLHTVLTLGENTQLAEVELSESARSTTEQLFSKALVSGNNLTFDMILLGKDRPIIGSGELAHLTFTTTDGSAPVVELTEVVVRDLDNQDLTAEVLMNAGALVPGSYELSQNYPNPFNPTTTIAYNLPEAGQVTLEIFNLLGRRVAVLVDEYQEAGRYTVQWDSRDASGKRVSSGVYLYRVNANDFAATRKMLLIK